MKTPYDGEGYENIGWARLFLRMMISGKTPGFYQYAADNIDKEISAHERRTRHHGLAHCCIICSNQPVLM